MPDRTSNCDRIWIECRRCGRPVKLDEDKINEVLKALDMKEDEFNDQTVMLVEFCMECVLPEDVELLDITVSNTGDIEGWKWDNCSLS